ncbi:MAG: C39 family peptidase [Candidatus Bathyarchaeia archaeon]
MRPRGVPFSNRATSIELPITRVKQINLCGCGLAALEMVLRYHGADVGQLDFLTADKRLRRRVQRKDPRGLSESTVGILALKRGFAVTLYGRRLRVSKTFLKLGGKVNLRRTSKRLILRLLNEGIPPIVKIPSARKAYQSPAERIPHYVVVKGVDQEGNLQTADPWYDTSIPRSYWEGWSSTIISVEGEHPRAHVDAHGEA